ncbi:GAP family protein [Gordonia sp. (in: high G+C Gram-positive bacteria)]|uniref:GAP family protein n=1 Tax=Gordonia sp. (in: high G+C Gram-positive bacteria) TaxID=84139 RepID=UPI003C772B76
MGTVLGDLLPSAIGVAVSPVPIIAAILMLLGKHARTTSLGFAAGWLVGIVAAVVVFVFVGGAMNTDDGPSSTVSWTKLVLGVLLLALGVRDWRSRSAAAAEPKWMAAIDEMKVPAGFGIGFLLAAVNPKNLMLCIAAGVTIGSAALSTGESIVGVAVFSVIAAISVVGPVIAYQVASTKLAGPLASLKVWLQANNQAVMAILFLVLGVSLFGKGLGGLF